MFSSSSDLCVKCGADRVIPGLVPSVPCFRTTTPYRKKRTTSPPTAPAPVPETPVVDPALRKIIDDAKYGSQPRRHYKPAGVPTHTERAVQSLETKGKHLLEEPDSMIRALCASDYLDEAARKMNNARRADHATRTLDMMRGSIAGAAFGAFSPEQLEIIEKTPIRGKLHYILMSRVFKRNLEAAFAFYEEMAKSRDPVSVKHVFRSSDLGPKYEEKKAYSVLTFLWDLVTVSKERHLYPELTAFFLK